MDQYVRARRAARILVVADGRVLLFSTRSSNRPNGAPSWLTPGGGLEGNEDARAGAVRELAEETGLLADPADLIGPIYAETIKFRSPTGQVRQSQEYFVLHRPRFAVDRSAQTDWELEWMGEDRWWSADELRATSERFFPPNLPDLVERFAVPE